MSITRRRFTGLAGSTLAALAVAPACRLEAFFPPAGDGRLKARPKPGVKTTAIGRVALGLGDQPRLHAHATARSAAREPAAVPCPCL